MLKTIGIAALTVRAVCVTKGELDCGIIQNVYQGGKNLGEGIVTHSETADVLSSETGLKSYLIPKDDFYKIWDSGIFEFDIEFVLPNDPVDPVKCDTGGNFEFVTRITL